MATTSEPIHIDTGPRRSVYDGFMSYSHAADDLLAPRLQSGLQRFAKPWWKRRALRIFRDESSLSANPHLWSSITEALDDSEWFVLLLSEEAAESEWVNREVQWWLDHKDPARIIPVVTDGEFTWADGDIGSDSTSAPPSLTGAFAEEPRWVDLRFARSETQLDLRNARFRDAVADIASAIRGVPKDELESEEVLQHRRTVRTAWGAATTLILLTVFALISTVIAFDQRSEARRQARIAVAEAEARAEAEIVAARESDRADEFERRVEERAGSIDTPLGTVAFYRLSGDSDTLPNGVVTEHADGFRAVNSGLDEVLVFDSDDGKAWTKRTSALLPAEGYVRTHGGLFWLFTQNETMWYSSDLSNWIEWVVPTPTLPAIDGLEWNASVGSVTPIADSWLIRGDVFGFADIYALAGVSDDGRTFIDARWDEEQGVLSIFRSTGPGIQETLRSVAFETVSSTEVRMMDADNGDEIASFTISDGSMTADELRLVLTRGGGTHQEKLAVAPLGHAVEWVDPPWQTPVRSPHFRLLSRDTELLSFVSIEEQGELPYYEVWRTTDGTSWERLGEPSFGGLPSVGAHFMVTGDLLVASARIEDPATGQETHSLWSSRNGTEWEPLPIEVGFDPSVAVHRLDNAHVVITPDGLWLSEDGTEWHVIESSQLAFDFFVPLEGGPSEWHTASAGDHLFVMSSDSETTVVWGFELLPRKP